MVNLVKAILSTKKSDQKQMKWLKKQLRCNDGDINKVRANMAPIHAAIKTENTEIVQQIVKTKGVDVDAVWKKERNGEWRTYGVLDVALFQLHPSIEIIKILVEYVRNPVAACGGVPRCILIALEEEYFEILELFREKALLFGAIDETKVIKLVNFAIRIDKPPVLRWLLQLPEVVSYRDEGEVRWLFTGLLDEAREDGRVEVCELLTEFMGKSLGGLEGGEVGMPLKDSKDSSKETKNHDDVIAVKVKYCWNCENPSRYMCVGCRKARYCESGCQWDDWDSHKEYCLVRMNKIACKEFEVFSPSIFQ